MTEDDMRVEKVEVMGMALERWTYRSCTADFGVGDDWATLYTIQSKEPGHGHATKLLIAARQSYECDGKRFRGTVPLNKRMLSIYKRLGIDHSSEA